MGLRVAVPLVLVLALHACGETERERPEGGSTIHVLFDERHDLDGGELVRLHEFDIGKELDEVDWSDDEQDLRERSEKLVGEMDEAIEESQGALAKRVDELVRELEEVGRSDEAQELKKRFERLLDELGERS